MENMKIQKIILIILIFTLNSFGQFGKNKVQYKQFEWKYIQSNHFDIYYNGNNKKIAKYTATNVEKSYLSIKDLFNWPLQKRYSIIIYNSHNDFQQTNTTQGSLSEGVGGFTELFKNRVIVPFTGSYKDFRHTLHHELVHAVMNDMYYGGSIQSLVSGHVKLQIPLWIAEGSAEFESLRWDTKSDMFMRDLALNSTIPPIEYISGYYVYKAGQSVLKFVNDTYGKKKLTEFYSSMKKTSNVKKAIKETFKIKQEEFNKKWEKYLKKEYWTDIRSTDDIGEIAVQLTDHVKLKTAQNVAPAISPSGTKIAFMSDRKGYADIYVMNSQDGSDVEKIVSGQRKASLEELKWVTPGISWSPNSKKIIFATKSGEYDALVIVDIESEKQEVIEIKKLNGIYSVAWNSKYKNIVAFSGHNGLQSDIYYYNFKKKKLVNLTKDKYSDSNPQWNEKGDKIIYVSERDRADDKIVLRHPYQNDLFEYDLRKKKKYQLTNTDYDEDYPFYDPNGRGIIYSSDKNGIFNIYVKKVDSVASYPITNITGGIFHLNIDKNGNSLVMSAFKNGGWDIYRMSSPFKLPKKTLQLTKFRKNQFKKENFDSNTIVKIDTTSKSSFTVSELKKPESHQEYKDFIFVPTMLKRNSAYSQSDSSINLDSSKIMTKAGEYKSNKYKTKFSVDLVNNQFAYSTFYGFQGQAMFMFSDVLGDHHIFIGTDLYIDLKNSDYSLSYFYLKKRMNFGMSYFNQSDQYYTYHYFPEEGYYDGVIVRYGSHGGSFYTDYPINKFYRIEANATYLNVSREILDQRVNLYESVQTAISSIAFVKDNTLFSYTAPMDGMRYRVQLEYMPKFGSDSPTYQSVTVDIRKYFKINFNYHFAFRFTGGESWGETPQIFMLGGVSNWLNYRYNADAPIFGNNTSNFSDDLEMYYLTKYVTPVRGVRYFEKYGSKYFLMNFEFRFPFIEYAKFRFPLPVNLWQVRGVIFCDVGSAWNGKFDPLVNNNYSPFGNEHNDLITSTGYGLRIFLGYFLLRIDTAWEYDGTGFSKPRYLFSLGGDF